MKKIALAVIISIGIDLFLNTTIYGWDNRLTHPAITREAINSSASLIDSYLATQLGLSDGIATELYWDFPADVESRMTRNNMVDPAETKTILDWLRAGSTIEDEDGKWKPWRPRHHFHDPTRNAGLDNHNDHPDWDAPGWSSWLPLGQSALNWAILGTAAQEPINNNEKWENARSTFYDSLRSTTKSVREAKLAESLLKLGCVLHLIEDMGVPAHTRNDFLFGHYRSLYDKGNPLETWAEEQIEANGGQCPWAGTGPVVFNELAKYFDTDTRNHNDYLGDGVSPPDTWGLAECTNYQFLSLSTVFGCLCV